MATADVPGAVASNCDQLRMGCWAEHKDGSRIFVYSVEGKRVIYSMFDTGQNPVVEYRDAMAERQFKRTFSWSAPSATPAAGIKWTWHDKTPFPWDDVIKNGAADGVRFAAASDVLSAAAKVAKSLKLRGEMFDRSKIDHLVDSLGWRDRVRTIQDKVSRAVRELRQ